MEIDNNPLVSVIIPFLNVERFIEEAVLSVINQHYTSWEIILVDDGSFDKSTHIAKKFAKIYTDKIIYLEHKDHANFGTSASRNLGIKKSSGKFITFLDSDDVYLNNKIEEQLKIFEKYPEIDVIISATKYWFGWENSSLRLKDFIQSLEVKDGIYSPPQLLKLMLTSKAAVPCMGGLMVRKSLLDKCCMMEEEFKGMYDDQVFYSKLILNSKVYIDNNYYDLYRQHNGSCYSQAKSSNIVLEYESKYLKWLDEYINLNFGSYKSLSSTIKKQIRLINYPKVYELYRRIRKIRKRFSLVH